MIKYLVTILICVHAFTGGYAQVFTAPSPWNAVYEYSVAVGERTAYLWIPPQCRHVRGIIMSLSNLTERRWLEDAIIRQAAAEEGLGIIWLGPALSLSKGPVLSLSKEPG